MRGGRDRGAPYARDGGYGRPRNGGGFGRDHYGGGGDRYDRFDDRGGMGGPRGGYDGGYERRGPNYEDRRGGSSGYGGDRRGGYNNGYGGKHTSLKQIKYKI